MVAAAPTSPLRRGAPGRQPPFPRPVSRQSAFALPLPTPNVGYQNRPSPHLPLACRVGTTTALPALPTRRAVPAQKARAACLLPHPGALGRTMVARKGCATIAARAGHVVLALLSHAPPPPGSSSNDLSAPLARMSLRERSDEPGGTTPPLQPSTCRKGAALTLLCHAPVPPGSSSDLSAPLASKSLRERLGAPEAAAAAPPGPSPEPTPAAVTPAQRATRELLAPYATAAMLVEAPLTTSRQSSRDACPGP